MPGVEQPETKAVKPARLFGKPDDLENNSGNEVGDMNGLDDGFGEDILDKASAKGRKRARGTEMDEDAPEIDEDALAYYENIASSKKQKKAANDDRIRVEKEAATEFGRSVHPLCAE